MKLKTLLLTTALVTSSAFADAPAPMEKKQHHHHNKVMEGYYAQVDVGATFPMKFKTTLGKLKYASTDFVGDIGLGYQVNEFFRSDVKVAYRNFASHSTKITTPVAGTAKAKANNAWTALLNVYVDGRNDTIFTPYLMAGVGAAHIGSKIQVATASGTSKKFGFAWNAGLGVLAKATDQISVDFAYRFVSLTKIGSTKALAAPVSAKVTQKALYTNDVTLGLIWHF